jgi:hypothetical protein
VREREHALTILISPDIDANESSRLVLMLLRQLVASIDMLYTPQIQATTH